ncbi:ArsR/SmtB family transcription factor [Nocardiopsis ansamitocini]|uniref:Transcriptional regulator n=1 Tax=Nocardiopsis ansamitocini TaxID=1670832 RepID=A0A9W6P8B2_9ACTN|nr:helix-turn-helix domain-containing protein [Nocardiopsis ansamitocini]GLU48833.1 transcriptional regulator [Nocardiopsis ansamitocini]
MATVADAQRDVDHPPREDIRLAGVLAALADPIRMRVVRELAAAGTTKSCVAFELPVSKSTCTHHFRVLREAGVIRQSYRGTARMNDLRRDDLDALFPGLLAALLLAAGTEVDHA